MNNVAPIGPRSLSPAQLDLIKRSVAKDTTPTEFDHFMHTASTLGLDPLRKQVIAVIYNKDKPDKRRMTIIVTQDGLRVIAARQGDYGPSREEPTVIVDEALKGPLNPQGLVKVSVRLWKRYGDGWQPVYGEAHWSEFAPVEDEWAYDESAGRRVKTGKQTLAENWARMPHIMLTKCATSAALRAGWPDAFSGVYTEEEVQRASVIDAASDLLEDFAEAERLSRIGRTKDMLAFIFDPRDKLVMVARDKTAEHIERWLHDHVTHPAQIGEFRRMNEESLRTFWAWEPKDALAIKRMLEEREAELAVKLGAGGDD